MIVTIVSLAFATLGALVNTHEEIIALVPILVILSIGLGFGRVTARDSKVLKPDNNARTVYVPGSTLANAYSP